MFNIARHDVMECSIIYWCPLMAGAISGRCHAAGRASQHSPRKRTFACHESTATVTVPPVYQVCIL